MPCSMLCCDRCYCHRIAEFPTTTGCCWGLPLPLPLPPLLLQMFRTIYQELQRTISIIMKLCKNAGNNLSNENFYLVTTFIFRFILYIRFYRLLSLSLHRRFCWPWVLVILSFELLYWLGGGYWCWCSQLSQLLFCYLAFDVSVLWSTLLVEKPQKQYDVLTMPRV